MAVMMLLTCEKCRGQFESTYFRWVCPACVNRVDEVKQQKSEPSPTRTFSTGNPEPGVGVAYQLCRCYGGKGMPGYFVIEIRPGGNVRVVSEITNKSNAGIILKKFKTLLYKV